jgi:arylsulfatase A-like enzyme
MRHPPTIPAGSRPGGLALTVDLAPTLLEFAGVPIGTHIQGRSLIPLVAGTPAGWRQSILVEFYTNEQPFPHLLDLDYRAVRTARYKYIHWIKFPDQDELYDLERDPFERQNLARVPAMAGVRTQMRDELARLVVESMGLSGR